MALYIVGCFITAVLWSVVWLVGLKKRNGEVNLNDFFDFDVGYPFFVIGLFFIGAWPVTVPVAIAFGIGYGIYKLIDGMI